MIANVGGFEGQGGKRDAVLLYCERLPTQGLEPSGIPIYWA